MPVRFEPDEDRVRWIGTATDIHELRETQERLRVQEEQLRDVDRRKDEFIAILAHELRNPLSSINLAAQLSRCPETEEERETNLSVIDRQVKNLNRLIEDLLDVSRVSKG